MSKGWSLRKFKPAKPIEFSGGRPEKKTATPNPFKRGKNERSEREFGGQRFLFAG